MTIQELWDIGVQKDLENKLMKIVDVEKVLKNPINILKIIVAISKINFDIDKETAEIITQKSNILTSVAHEDMGKEIFEILNSKRSHYYIKLLNDLNILGMVFPEILEMKQVGECKYHVVDALTHSLYTLEILEEIINNEMFFEKHLKVEYENHCMERMDSNINRLSLIKLGALFHDIGKPAAKKVDKNNRVRFKGHEVVGADIIRNIGQRFNLSEIEKDILYKYVYLHMIPLVLYKTNDLSGRNLYKVFIQTQNETLDITLIGYADIVATVKLLDPKEEIGKFKIHIEYIANNYVTRYKSIENISDIIKDEDIINIIGEEDINLISDLTEEVKKAIFIGKISKDKQKVIRYIKNLIS